MAFRELGHEAYSCDVLEPSGGHPEWHIMGDAAVAVLGGAVTTMDGTVHEIGKWDLLIAHPPCTYMANSSAVRMRKNGVLNQERYAKAMAAKEFFLKFYNADVPRIAVENPTPLKVVNLPPYTQAVHPYWFGHPYSKRTCLWLKNLPPLEPTDMVSEHTPFVDGGSRTPRGEKRVHRGGKERDPVTRSKTFRGLAKAMAAQWGGNIRTENT